jgi:hypothetical protein
VSLNTLYSLFFGINKIIAGKIPVNDFYRHQANFIFREDAVPIAN